MISTEITLRTQFYDLDPMNIVWHGNYVRYLEQARSALLSEIGYGYAEMQASGFAWPIVDLWRMRPRLGPGGVGQIAFVGGALGSMVLMLIFTGLLGRSTMILCMMLALAATMSRMRAPVAVERRPRSPRVSIIGKRAAVPAE